MESSNGISNWRTSGKLSLLYAQSYFISVATVLGTGILGLPSTLSYSGFYPFLISFIMNYILQVLSICQMMEVLQYAKAICLSTQSRQTDYSRIMPERQSLINNGTESDDTSTDENQSHSWVSGHSNNEEENKTMLEEAPRDKLSLDTTDGSAEISGTVDTNFHVIGKLFLPKILQPIFLLFLFVQFVVITISYSLAGSEAYAQVFGISMETMIPYFTWILGLIVIFGHTIIKPGIAVMTLAKGSLLFATVE